MGLSSVTNTSGATNVTQSSTSTKEGSSIDKEAFLKLLVAQLQHQDPLQPTEGTEFVAQLSQFAMVEQSIAQSAKLDSIATQMTGLSSNEAAALVGKNVTVRGTGIAFDGLTATSTSVSLASAATKTTVQIQDSSGQTVRTLELGAHGAGALPITWDGKDDHGNTVSKGTYTIKTTATTADGRAVDVSQNVSGTVNKVSFEKGYPEVTLDSGVTAPISDLVSVSVAGGASVK